MPPADGGAEALRAALGRAKKDPPYKLAYGTAARSNSDRWGEIVDPMELGGKANGVDDDVPGLHAARDVILARGRGRLKMPPGVIRTNSPVDMRPLHGLPYQLIGHGSRVTQCNMSHNAGPFLYHGDPAKFGAGRTESAEFRDFAVYNNYGAFTLAGDPGVAFELSSCDMTEIEHIRFNGMKKLMTIGENANGNSVNRLSVDHIVASDQGQAVNFIDLVSGSSIAFGDDCMFNGSGTAAVFGQSATSTNNIDGLTVGAILCENWKRLLTIEGVGLSTVKFRGGHNDRAADFDVYENLVAGGVLRDVTFSDWMFESADDAVSVAASTVKAIQVGAGAGQVYGFNTIDCNFVGKGAGAADYGNAQGVTHALNTHRDCAANTVLSPSLISMGAGSTGLVLGNKSLLVNAAAMYRALSWGGGSTPTSRMGGFNAWAAAPSHADSGVA